MASTLSHAFDGRSWRIIKEFAGIYGVKMNYSKIAKLSRNKLSNAYFEEAKLSLDQFDLSIAFLCKYNKKGEIISLNPDTPCGTRPFNKSAKQWKTLILKRVAQGYKNRQFYEALAKLVNPPQKVTCICGLKVGPNAHQQNAHYRTRAHVNRMLKCVPLSEVMESSGRPVPAAIKRWGSTVPAGWPLRSNSYMLSLRRWSNSQRSYLSKQVDLRPYMEQREINQTQIYNYCSGGGSSGFELTNELKKEVNWDRTYFTMDHMLVGGWCPC